MVLSVANMPSGRPSFHGSPSAIPGQGVVQSAQGTLVHTGIDRPTQTMRPIRSVGFVRLQEPAKASLISPHACRMRYSINQAVFCVLPMSRCSFTLGAPFKLVNSRWMAINPLPEHDLGLLQHRSDLDGECIPATGPSGRRGRCLVGKREANHMMLTPFRLDGLTC